MAATGGEQEMHSLRAEVLLGDQPAERRGDVVLVALDGSDHSEQAFAWYVEHLHRPDNYVILLHSIEMPSVPTRELWDYQMEYGNQKKMDIGEKYTKKFKELKICGKLVSDYERPGEMIVYAARREGATYIVMGTRGLGKIRRTVLGSVSDFVVHHAPCPVIVARDSKK